MSSHQIDQSQDLGKLVFFLDLNIRGFWWDSLAKPPFGVTSAEVVIICPDGS